MSWNKIVQEIRSKKGPDGRPDIDRFRRDEYTKLEALTKRPLVVYATDFLNRAKVQACRGEVEIDLSDRQGMIEVTQDLPSGPVDFLISSPGGLPDAADSLVHILRRRFDHVRIIVMTIAKSAATMIALSADEILMDENAELGPIDPQFQFMKGDGTPVVAPAQAIIDQFDAAQKLLGSDPKRLTAWIPILQQYGPALYQQCHNAIELSKSYGRQWLEQWMFKGDPDAKAKADKVVAYLGSHNEFKSHGARIGVEELLAQGVRVKVLQKDHPELVEQLKRVSLALIHTFESTSAFRLWENSRGAALLRVVQQQVIEVPVPMPGGPGPPRP